MRLPHKNNFLWFGQSERCSWHRRGHRGSSVSTQIIPRALRSRRTTPCFCLGTGDRPQRIQGYGLLNAGTASVTIQLHSRDPPAPSVALVVDTKESQGLRLHAGRLLRGTHWRSFGLAFRPVRSSLECGATPWPSQLQCLRPSSPAAPLVPTRAGGRPGAAFRECRGRGEVGASQCRAP
jgi:hypothetical protein